MRRLTVFICLMIAAVAILTAAKPYGNSGTYGQARRSSYGVQNHGGAEWTPVKEGANFWLDARYGIDGYDTLWTEQIQGIQFVQSTDANLCSLEVNVQDGLPAMYFDSTDFMIGTDIELHSNVKGFTIFAVVKTLTSTADLCFVSKYSSTNRREWNLRSGIWAPQDQSGSYVANQAVAITPSTGAKILTGWWKPGFRARAYKNGALIDSAVTAIIDITDTDEPLCIGAVQQGAAYTLRGYICCIVGFDEALTDAERLHIEQQLNKVWRVY